MILWRKLRLVAILGLILAGCNMPLSNDQKEGTPSITPSQVPETTSPPSSSITGRVWHDLCAIPPAGQAMPSEPPEGCIRAGESFQADGVYSGDEPGIEGILVDLGLGDCPSIGLAETTTSAQGLFTFDEVEPGSYCVSIDPSDPENASVLLPGIWTSNPLAGSSVIARTLTLGPKEDVTDIEFGWDYQLQPSYPEVPTETPEPTEISPTSTPTHTPQASNTPQATNPDLPAGDPDYVDSMNNAGNWFSGVSSYDDEHVRFEIADSKMKMTAFNPDLYEGWTLSWPVVENFYLEASFTTSECSGRDRYGLFLRGTNISENPHGYLFGVTCDGKYSLRTFDEEFTVIVGWTSSSYISSGSDQTNTLGFWAKGDQIRMYVNGNRLGEVQDSTFDAGPFGLFVGSADTDSLTVEVDSISYWKLP